MRSDEALDQFEDNAHDDHRTSFMSHTQGLVVPGTVLKAFPVWSRLILQTLFRSVYYYFNWASKDLEHVQSHSYKW